MPKQSKSHAPRQLELRMKAYIKPAVIFLILMCESLVHAYGTDNGKGRFAFLQDSLRSYAVDKDARVGIAVILNGRDTVAVDGDKDFPMMSVFKFPLALTVAHSVDLKASSLSEMINIRAEDLKENTYSPMLRKYGSASRRMSLRELMEWALIESDNNAADILLNYIGGPEGMNAMMEILKMPTGITVGASEDDMHRDPWLCYLNRSTPIAMASLFDRFNSDLKTKTESFRDIAGMLEQCRTGGDRLAEPLKDSGCVIGHKTGTGGSLVPGRISAINDCGYVNLSEGTRYSIAVFIADSAYGMAETSRMIAEISSIVFEAVKTTERNVESAELSEDGSFLLF